MQINVHDTGYQGCNVNAKIAISQKLICYTFSFLKRNCAKYFEKILFGNFTTT